MLNRTLPCFHPCGSKRSADRLAFPAEGGAGYTVVVLKFSI